jgi:AcrR family transcriptional regulator
MLVVTKLDRKMTTRRTRLPAAERRETILRAATEVFAEAGYRAGKVSEIAARVGVTEPVVFQNFGSKAVLYAAVLERAAAAARTSLDHLATASGSASELLTRILAGSAPGHPDPAHAGAAYGVLFADAIALTAEPELTETARDAFGAVAAHLADLIRLAQAGNAPAHGITHSTVSGIHRGAAEDPVKGADADAAAWLLLSVLAARPLRNAAMPAGLEPAVTALAIRAISP